DEEEEFERIVMDKSKKTDATEAARAAQEQIEQARVEREHRIEATHERAEPLIDAESPVIEAALVEAPEGIEAPQPSVAEQAREQEGGVRKRGRRGRRRGRGEEHAPEVSAGQEAELTPALADEEITTPFVADAGSFERVVDEDEVVAAENGEMFKDARLQERIFDQIHAVEFDIEDVPTTEVGTLLSSERPAASSFQRIDDSDIATAGEEREPALVQETVAAHVGAFIDEIKEETVGTQTFERVSDDEGAVVEEEEAGAK